MPYPDNQAEPPANDWLGSEEFTASPEDLPELDLFTLREALAQAGLNEGFRNSVFEALRQAEEAADDPAWFRSGVRLPIIRALLDKAQTHRVVLEGGLVFEVGPVSRIEQALLLSASAHPDHVWEPQTTRLLVILGRHASNVIVGGAYIGDQAVLIARAMAKEDPAGKIHAFEPMDAAFRRLLRHVELNGLTNVIANRQGLWDGSGLALRVEGPPGLAPSLPVQEGALSLQGTAVSITIDDYVNSQRLGSVGLIMLDTEGGEFYALRGAAGLLSRPFPESPHLVFEVHRSYVDWSNGLENTPIIDFVTSQGYSVYAIRDFHDNYPMAGKPIEIIPVNRVYLEGPPHGFNLLATKDAGLVKRLGLRVVENVSPKLLVGKDPGLHHPLDGLAR
jgi:FkbM family methyltransferase